MAAGAIFVLRGHEAGEDATGGAPDGGAAPAEDVPYSGPLVSWPSLEVTLPAGWSQERRPDGKLRYTPTGDGGAGELVVMRQPEDAYVVATRGKSLGALASYLGVQLELGKPGRFHDEPAAMGTLGYATFEGVQPALFVAVTRSPTSIYTWTWTGPDANAQAMDDALGIARSAREEKNPVGPDLAAFLANLETLSQSLAMVRGGADAKEVYVAIFMNDKKELAAEERPTMAGVLGLARLVDGFDSGARAPTPLRQSFRLNLDADPSHMLALTLSLAARPVAGDESVPKVRVVLERATQAWSSERLRRRAIALWALPAPALGPPADAVSFDAVVLGTHLVRSRLPAYFTDPGGGQWTLLKTMQPGELYIALEVEAGLVEIFPKKPEEPTEAARRLYQLF